MAGAYVIIWGASFIFILTMLRRQAKLDAELKALQEVARKKKPDDSTVAQGSVAMTTATRRSVFLHALAFVLGFSTVFVVLGASVAFIGYALNQYLPTFVKIGGLILIVFGLYVAGTLSWIANKIRQAGGDRNLLGHTYIVVVDGLGRLMYTEGRVHVKADHRLGYLSSFLMGIFFSAGWIHAWARCWPRSICWRATRRP